MFFNELNIFLARYMIQFNKMQKGICWLKFWEGTVFLHFNMTSVFIISFFLAHYHLYVIKNMNCLESTFVKLNTLKIQTTDATVLCDMKENYYGIFQSANISQLTLIIIFAVLLHCQ